MNRVVRLTLAGLGLVGGLRLGPAPARADALTSYQVIDLGTGDRSTWSASPDPDQFVVAKDGRTAYPFQYLDNNTHTYGGVGGGTLPPLNHAPVGADTTYGNPNNAYSHILDTFTNRDGYVVSTEDSGVRDHWGYASTMVYATQRQPDGTYGPWVGLWGVGNTRETGGPIADAVALNNQNLILGQTADPRTNYTTPEYLLYNLNTKTSTELSALLPGWHVERPGGLDDQGRLLVIATRGSGDGDHTLLLSPPGVATDPVPVPEPGTLAVVGMGLTAFVLGRRRGSKTGGDTSGRIC